MTKAERKKRAKERKKTREQQAARSAEQRASAAGTTPSDAAPSGGRSEPGPSAPPARDELSGYPQAAPQPEPKALESEFITGPVGPLTNARTRSASASVYIDAPVRIEREPAEQEDESEDAEDESEERDELAEGGDDEDDDDEDEEGDGEGDEAEDDDDEDDDDERYPLAGEDDDEDDEDDDIEDALFNVACLALERGEALSWNEVVTCLFSVEVDDPRLALLGTLLVTTEEELERGKKPALVSGAAVLASLESLDCQDLIDEAREEIAENPSPKAPEEAAVVRQGAPVKAAGKVKERAVKASELRDRQSALGTSDPVVAAAPAPRRTVLDVKRRPLDPGRRGSR